MTFGFNVRLVVVGAKDAQEAQETVRAALRAEDIDILEITDAYGKQVPVIAE